VMFAFKNIQHSFLIVFPPYGVFENKPFVF
jgi:hypothetical protein